MRVQEVLSPFNHLEGNETLFIQESVRNVLSSIQSFLCVPSILIGQLG